MKAVKSKQRKSIGYALFDKRTSETLRCNISVRLKGSLLEKPKHWLAGSPSVDFQRIRDRRGKERTE